MAITNQQRIGKGLDLLRDGLSEYVQREFQSKYNDLALPEAQRYLGTDRLRGDKPIDEWDAAALLRLMWESWNDVFRNTLGHAERTLVSELRTARDRWAHQHNFSSDDADRALDSMERILSAVSATQVEDVRRMKMELRRLVFDEQARSEKRKTTGTLIEPQAANSGGLKPWREVVVPHPDVASGRYQQAEFAADLWQVHVGEGTDEYKDPVEFFRRTYLTESLKQLLSNATRRLTGQGGDPVVQLQTNFGGGKTHSMLALYHLFSGTAVGQLVGIEPVLKEAEVNNVPAVRRVVLVGNKISPGNPSVKSDGTVVRTLWGELAWQLGFAKGGLPEAKKAFQRVAADDEHATSPGDELRKLMNDYGPSLILIDEWVAYARQLHDSGDLPGGSFETHFSFAQALTESAKLAKECLLVISLPASDLSGSPHTQADDVEVGGVRGRAALERLRNIIGRIESSWRPATAEEGFEIVRRRLFQPLAEQEHYTSRDVVARAFYELYRTQQQEFPPECNNPDYEKRLRAAYPIHPEVFDRLYSDWSTLVKFQRTRGVLRLMAAVIHSLWEKGDRNPLIMPANIPLDDLRVIPELTSRYLSENWVPVIEKDVDGPSALPLRLDGEVPNLGKYAACRRVARTIYLGSAPTAAAANRGLEDRRIKLGCVMPGESPAIFGDAMRRMSASATFLYNEGVRYWYSTQPTVTKLADDRAEQLKREPDKVIAELEKRVRDDVQRKGDFSRVHPLPATGADVSDDTDTRLVVLSLDAPYSKGPNNPAEKAAQEILESRGNAPRLYRNALVFLAVDKTRLQDLDEAVRRYLAWKSIVKSAEELELQKYQIAQAETQLKAADTTVQARLPEAYQWLLAPSQDTPQAPLTWTAARLTGLDGLAVRAGKKLISDGVLVPAMTGTGLRLELDKTPLWRGNHVVIQQLIEDFARYSYLPRLKDSGVLYQAIADGLSLLTWGKETFALADSFDEKAQRYRGLRAGRQNLTFADNPSALLVRPDAALKQMEEDEASARAIASTTISSQDDTTATSNGVGGVNAVDHNNAKPAAAQLPKRFHGTVTLDSTRAGRDAGRIADEVLAHLNGLVGAEVEVTLHIAAKIPQGASEHIVRTVTENCRTLKFSHQEFEKE